jgi:hypothetical protein
MFANLHVQKHTSPVSTTKKRAHNMYQKEIKRSSLGRPESTRMKVCRAQIAVADNVA